MPGAVLPGAPPEAGAAGQPGAPPEAGAAEAGAAEAGAAEAGAAEAGAAEAGVAEAGCADEGRALVGIRDGKPLGSTRPGVRIGSPPGPTWVEGPPAGDPDSPEAAAGRGAKPAVLPGWPYAVRGSAGPAPPAIAAFAACRSWGVWAVLPVSRVGPRVGSRRSPRESWATNQAGRYP
jgi:hypothetical protein